MHSRHAEHHGRRLQRHRRRLRRHRRRRLRGLRPRRTHADGVATPFLTIQAALDFADTHRNVANRVCVASGPTCADSSTYGAPTTGDLTMHDGISLLGSFESTGWTRCAQLTTHLALTTDGVVFPASIGVTTALDGFVIDLVYDAVSANGVSVIGARGVVLSNLDIENTIVYPFPAHSSGVALVSGAHATVVQSRIAGARGSDPVSIRSLDSEVVVEDNCSASPDGTTGRCSSACSASGLGIWGNFAATTDMGATIVLQNSPHSRIERSTLCVTRQQAAGIIVSGAAAGIVLRGNTVASAPVYSGGLGLHLAECGDDAPWIVDNDSLSLTVDNVPGTVIDTVGACHPVIEANAKLANQGSTPTRGTVQGGLAIDCTAGSVPSRCVVVNNPFIAGMDVDSSGSGPGGSAPIGINCRDQSCARIENNRINGLTCVLGDGAGYGLMLGGGPTSVLNNFISYGDPHSMYEVGTGVMGVTTAEFSHNSVEGGFVGAAAVFDSNVVTGVMGTDCAGFCPTVTWAGGGTVTNNCIQSGYDVSGLDTVPFKATSSPASFIDNELQGYIDLYVDPVAGALTTVDQINALTDMTVSGTLAGPCSAPPYPN